MSRWLGPLRLLASIALVLLPLRGVAAELQYEAPSSCPPADELSFGVERALGSSLERAPALRFEVTIRETSAAFVATLAVSSSRGAERVRTLNAPDCAQLIDALSVAIVLAMGEAESEASSEAREAEDAEPGSAPVPTELGAQAQEPEPSQLDDGAAIDQTVATSPQATYGVSLWLLADVGSLPSAAPGLGLSAQIGLSGVVLRALGAVWLEQHVALPLAVSPQPGADLNLFFGSLSVCYEPRAARTAALSVGGCLQWEMGQLYGRGTGVSAGRSDGILWLGPGAALEMRWYVLGPALHLGAQIGATVPLNRNEFFLNGIGDVHRPSSLVGRAALGVGWAL